MTIGDEVRIDGRDYNAVIHGVRCSPWGGLEFNVEIDEMFPYVGLPNPRRRVYVHESHLELKS